MYKGWDKSFYRDSVVSEEPQREFARKKELETIGIDKIRAGSKNINFMQGNILTINGRWNKIYLSNILNCGYVPNWNILYSKLFKKGIIYMSFLVDNEDLRKKYFPPKNYFSEDERLSQLAQDIERKIEKRWKPLVLRRK